MDTKLCLTPLRPFRCYTASASFHPFPSFIRKRTNLVPRLCVTLENTEGSAVKEQPFASVVRRLILLRHADSSWTNSSIRDHDRPLSDDGRANAGDVAYKLQQLGWVPEVILCSDATRTKETLAVMQEQVKDFFQATVHFCPSFYSVAAMDGQTAEHLQQMICKFSRDDIFTVMCMGHNKGWEEAASMFSGTIIELKTCNAALLEARGESWEQAFTSAGFGGWKFHGIVKPDESLENFVTA